MPFYFPEIPFQAEVRYPKSLIGKNFCAYLLELRNSSSSFKGIRKALIDTLLDGYESARYGTGVSAGTAAPGPRGRAGARSCTPVRRLDCGHPVTSAGFSTVFSLCVQVFGKPEYLKYQDALNELANM